MAADTLAIVNPIAGHGRAARVWPLVEADLERRGVSFDTCITGGPGDASECAAKAVRDGRQLVISVGGDGTLNEIVNGLFVDGTPDIDGTRLGVISCGTGCDFVRTLGVPPGEAGVEALFSGHTQTIDVGQVVFSTFDGETRRRYFVNSADLGVGAEAAAKVNRSSKRLGGFLSFALSAITSILSSRPREMHVVLDDASPLTLHTDLIMVTNGRYAGGGMMFAPRASLTDGLLDIVALEPVSRLRLLLDIFPKVYSGRHLDHPKVIFRRAERVSVSSPLRQILEVDGELPGQAPAEFSIVPGALRIAVPATAVTPAAEDLPANASRVTTSSSSTGVFG